jgi:hypothetical protein
MSKNKQKKKKTSIAPRSILAKWLIPSYGRLTQKIDKKKRQRRLHEQIKEQAGDHGIILTNSQIQQGLRSLPPEERHHPSHLVYALTDIKA